MRGHDHRSRTVADGALIQRFVAGASVPSDIRVTSVDYCSDCGRFGPTVRFLAPGIVTSTIRMQVEGWLASDQGLRS